MLPTTFQDLTNSLATSRAPTTQRVGDAGERLRVVSVLSALVKGQPPEGDHADYYFCDVRSKELRNWARAKVWRVTMLTTTF